MKRYARSENRKIVRKLSDPSEAAAAASEIGSSVFPFRSPPPSMPSVGTRRSTRIFVPKAATAPPCYGPARALRSSRRLAASAKRSDWDRHGWLRVFGGDGDTSPDLRWRNGEEENGGSGIGVIGWHESLGQNHELRKTEGPPETGGRKEHADSLKMFGISYSRKRRLQLDDSASSSSSKGWRYGISYTRKRPRKKPNVASIAEYLVGEIGIEARKYIDDAQRTKKRDRELEIAKPAKNLAQKAGILAGDLCAGSGGQMALAVLVDSSCSSSSIRFQLILVSLLAWMRRARMSLWDFASFLFSKSFTAVFSLHGIHFIPIQRWSTDALSRNAISGCGLCKIFGAKKSVPLLSLDFSVLPHYFKSLHVMMVLDSQYLPGVLIRYLIGLNMNASFIIQSEEYDSHAHEEKGYSGSHVASPVIPAVKRNRLPSIAEATDLVAQNAVIVDGSGLRKHQRKRSSLRHSKAHNPSSVDSHGGSLLVSSCSLLNSVVQPVRVKPLDVCLDDLISIREENGVSCPFVSHRKHKRSSRKCPVEGTKDLKQALTEVKKNIDSVRCNANILVSNSDSCWREEGAEVMLESTDSDEWCIAVKTQGTLRYLHKPQDMRPCVINRFTHAYMWAGEDGWKLEFSDKWDWYIFKELHLECRERNMLDAPLKIIPIPGVHEVSGYDEIAASSFVRPDIYIHMMDGEVERALTSEIANYEIDSGDEEFLKKLNSRSFDGENNSFEHVSEDNFEKIVFCLEKDAYNCPDNISDKERALDLCRDLGGRDIVAEIFDYWFKKRSKRRAALVKVFQHTPPLRRRQSIQNPLLRKKRSLAGQRSHAGRGKPLSYFQAGAKEEALRRVQEAESAACNAVEPAIHLRSRVQMFMTNAELATYKSVMALRIAEAKQVSESPDFSASILD